MKIFVHPASGYSVISNLSWEVLDSFEESFFGHTRIPKLIEAGARLHATYVNGSETNIGTTKIDFDDPKAKPKTVSFAAAIAKNKKFATQTCLVLMTADEARGSVLACALISGNVVLDDQCESHDIEFIYKNFAELCEKSGRRFAVHGDIAPPRVNLIERVTLNELLAKKPRRGLGVSQLRSDKVLLMILVGAGIFIVVLGALAAWDWYEDRIKANIAAIQGQMQSPEYMYADSAKAFLAKPVFSLPATFAEIASDIDQIPLTLAGWRLTQIACESSTCSATWKSSGGTYVDFQKEAPSGWGKLVLSQGQNDVYGDLQTIRHGLQISVKPVPLAAPSSWPRAEEFALTTGVDLQKLKPYEWTLQLGSPVQQAIPPGVNPQAVAAHPSAVHAMPWTVTRQAWGHAKLILPLFKDNVTLERFEVFFDEKDSAVTFSGAGLAHVKK